MSSILHRRQRIVCRNTAGVPVREGEHDAGAVHDYLTKAVDGRSIAAEFESRDLVRWGAEVNELGAGPAGGTFVMAPDDLETIPLRPPGDAS